MIEGSGGREDEGIGDDDVARSADDDDDESDDGDANNDDTGVNADRLFETSSMIIVSHGVISVR